VKILSKFIAPWALAQEQFPLHLIWEPVEDFDTIELLMPEEFEVKEILNVKRYDVEPSKISFARENMLTPNYFTAILNAKKPYAETVVHRTIQIRFKNGQSIKYYIDLTARIVRPVLRIVSVVPVLTIRDGSPRDLFKLKFLHSGM
jgi:hypothetical protein